MVDGIGWGLLFRAEAEKPSKVAKMETDGQKRHLLPVLMASPFNYPA